MEFINRIRKKALTDEELSQALAWEAQHGGQKQESDEALRTRLSLVMNEAIPLMVDTESFDWNLRKLREQFNARGFVVSGKILETKKANLNDCAEYIYDGQTVKYPR